MAQKSQWFGIVRKFKMKLLNNYYRGLICRCPNCFAVLGYGPEDIHKNSYITCPSCKFEILTKMILDYDGLIKEESEEKKDDSVV